jgi:hypothetical protein
MQNHALPEDWEILRSWLPPDLQAHARAHQFLRRARGHQDAERWLQMILMHVAGGLSLEQTVLRAQELEWFSVSPVAFFKRLRQAEFWLCALTQRLLAEQQARLQQAPWPQRWTVRLLDATDIQEPGPTGTAWRLHYALRLPEMVCDHFELTDGRGGEKLGRFTFAPGELIIVDRGYCHRAGVATVLQAQAEVLVRWNPHSFPLEGAQGQRLDLLAWLRRLPARAARERTVYFSHAGQRYPLRLCAVRKSRQATERAQARARRNGHKHGRGELQPETAELAGFVLLLCSVATQDLSTLEVLEFYRGRWQVELAFKRLKSLLAAGHLPKQSAASARSWMQAKLLTALLIERVLWEGEFLSPWGYRLEGGESAQSLEALSGDQ